MKILIVSVYFPPQNSIASMRAYSWAKYWSRWNHDITVLTTKKVNHPADSPQNMENFDLIEVPLPAEKLGTKFKKKVKEQKQKNSNEENNIQKITNFRISHLMLKFISKLKTEYGVFNKSRMPDIHDIWAIKAFLRINHESWDAVITTAWPYSTHFVGYFLKRKGLTKTWCMDWRDLWVNNHVFPGLPVFRQIEKMIEGHLHKKADLVTTVSEPLATVLRQKPVSNVRVIYNGFDQEEYQNLSSEKAFKNNSLFRIIYTGTIYIEKQDPTILFKAISELSSSGKISPSFCRIIMAGHNADLSELAKVFGIESYYQYIGFVPREKALKLQRDADLLLFLEYNDPKIKGILTGKLFEYLFAGPPIISIGSSNLTEAGKIIKETGKGFVVGTDIERLKDLIYKFMIRVKKNKSKNYMNIHPNLSFYSRMNQARELLSSIKDQL